MKNTLLDVALAAGVLVISGASLAQAASQAPSAMATAQSGPAPLIEEKLPSPAPGASFTRCYPENAKPGHSYIESWKVGAYTAETWFSKNFKGSKSCLTTHSDKSFQIDWEMQVYGFLHEVGLYGLSIKVDDIRDDVKGRHVHELRNVTGGGGYTGLYGWFEAAGQPESIELYINDNWAGEPINMSDTIKMGTIEVDGGTYEVYTRPRRGSMFAQWWSNRVEPRTSGEISYARHFQAWRKFGMPNVSLTRLTYSFEVKWGKPSSGSAVYKSFHIDPPLARGD